MDPNPFRYAVAASALDLPAARRARDGLASLLHTERAAAAEFLTALADFDQRQGWAPLGHASLFAFLSVELRLSKGAAFWRLSAARLLQRFPDLIEPLKDGRLCLSTTAELAKVLTEENRAAVLPRYFGLSAREAREVTAELLPCPVAPVRDVVTSGAQARLAVAGAVKPIERSTMGAVLTSEPDPTQSARETVGASMGGSAEAVAPALRAAALPSSTDPLTADLSRLHVTVSRAFLCKLEAAKAALSHTHQGGGAEAILEAGLDLILAQQARRKGLVAKPRAPKAAPEATAVVAAPELALPPDGAPPGPRYIPASVRRAVWRRDEGRCQWPLEGGGRCGSTLRVQFDHLVPRARGGQPTIANLRLCCAFHNQRAARLAFGDGWMDQFGRREPPRTG